MNVPSNDIESGGISHIGPVREENQDSICWAEDIAESGASLFAVADGMGGYNHGKLASSMALDKPPVKAKVSICLIVNTVPLSNFTCCNGFQELKWSLSFQPVREK